MSEEIEIVGRLDGYSAMDLGNRVYSIDGDTPSMHAHAGDTLAKVLVKQATDKGYAECKIGGVADLNYPSSSTRRGRVQEEGDVCPTLTTESQPSVIETRYRIRKLTPRECWRLMDFRDEDFDKAEKVNSNSQLYKQAGNSIVVACLEQIFMELF